LLCRCGRVPALAESYLGLRHGPMSGVHRGANPLADEDLTMVDAVVGQLLAFFRCLHTGLRPDAPSDEGVITRVVQSFAIHKRS
jgi:hypothetical protein